jgi:hypothetical protein
MKASIVTESPSGLWCPRGGFHIDPWDAVERAVITHAHGDHARPGSAAYLCAAPSAGLLRRRFGSDARIESVEYGETVTLGDVRVSFHPAGHVLGSAQIRLDSNEGVWVIAGDYKRAADPTCAPFDPLRCDTFVTESTFGLPIYRWDETATIVDDIDAWWRANADAGRTSVLFCYTIGKAQRLLAELMRVTDRTIYVHGMMLGMIEAYRACGVSMLPVTPVIEKTGPSTGLRAGRGRSAVASFAGARNAMDAAARRRLGCVCVGPHARPRRPPTARVRSRLRALRSRRLAGARVHHPGDRRHARPCDARVRRAARALSFGARHRSGHDTHRVGGRAVW